MTTDQAALLGLFESRVHQLMKLCDELREKISRMETQHEELEKSYDALLEENKVLKYKYDNLKMVKIISVKQDDFKAAKNRLSKLVREVDKCIALLNE